MDREPQVLCLVAPCYNEAEVILSFYERLKSVLNGLSGLECRLILVDDGSTDATLEMLNAIARKDPAVLVYSLSRNFGHQIALTAGLDFARGDAVIMIDSDLQHPPELIPEMVRLWREGNDVVSAVRRHTADSGPFKKLSSSLFYRLINIMSDTTMMHGAADFCLLSRRAHAALRKLPEQHRFLRGMVSWIGFRRTFLHFDAPPRVAGRSKYTFLKMMRLALNAVFSFSAVPIRLAAQLGFLTILCSLVYLAYALFHYFFRADVVPGWASTIFVVTFFGGVQLLFVGVLGEYIARIFEETKRRPTYLLKQEPSSRQEQSEPAPSHPDEERETSLRR